MLLEQFLDGFFPFGREESRPPGMLPEDAGPKKPPDGIHQAVAEEGAHHAGRQGVIPLQGTGPAGHAGRHDRHFLGNGQADARERQKEHDAEVGTPLEPLDHVLAWVLVGGGLGLQRGGIGR